MSSSDLYSGGELAGRSGLRLCELDSGGSPASTNPQQFGGRRGAPNASPRLLLLRTQNDDLGQAAARQPTAATQIALQARAATVSQSILKRLLDLAGALAGLIFLAPFFLIVAAMIRLESPGPAIFKQRRTGRAGEVFSIYKFRTMSVLEDDAAVVQAVKGDCRITTLGAFLRRSCIDELPQLWNVLVGEMSLVGPRPHALVHDAYYGQLIDEYDSRFLVRPGIAGLAQVGGYRGPTESLESMADRVALDREYIASWTIGLDVRILIAAVVRGPFDPAAH